MALIPLYICWLSDVFALIPLCICWLSDILALTSLYLLMIWYIGPYLFIYADHLIYWPSPLYICWWSDILALTSLYLLMIWYIGPYLSISADDLIYWPSPLYICWWSDILALTSLLVMNVLVCDLTICFLHLTLRCLDACSEFVFQMTISPSYAPVANEWGPWNATAKMSSVWSWSINCIIRKGYCFTIFAVNVLWRSI